MPELATSALYDAIARPGGGFAMVAVDARESMRGMFRDAGRSHQDDDLAGFKEHVVSEVAPHASAVLCDPQLGGRAITSMRRDHPSTGLIVAVDDFDEARFGPLRETRLNLENMATAIAGGGVSAVKLYVFWRPHHTPRYRADDVRRFVETARELGVLSLVEGVVTASPEDADFDDALVRAAEDFGRHRPDIYKTQTPTFGRADDEVIERESRRVSDAIGRPWVVLSKGVQPERFPSAAAAACRGGASGVLAGRAVWGPALAADDPRAELAIGGRARLDALIRVVDEEARPWRAAMATTS